jgi:hypothetical protein
MSIVVKSTRSDDSCSFNSFKSSSNRYEKNPEFSLNYSPVLNRITHESASCSFTTNGNEMNTLLFKDTYKSNKNIALADYVQKYGDKFETGIKFDTVNNFFNYNEKEYNNKMYNNS